LQGWRQPFLCRVSSVSIDINKSPGLNFASSLSTDTTPPSGKPLFKLKIGRKTKLRPVLDHIEVAYFNIAFPRFSPFGWSNRGGKSDAALPQGLHYLFVK